MAQITKKNLTVISIIVIVLAGWFIAAHFFGPNSERWVSGEVERLKKDSIALQGNFVPKGQYSNIRDILSEVQNIRDLGNPLRFGNTEIDSVRLFENKQTGPIARYNMAKADSVTVHVLPLWRSAAALALGRQLKEANPNSIVRINIDYPNNEGLLIYSISYLDKEDMENDAHKFNPILAKLGFKSIRYSASPNNVGTEYTFN